MCDKHPILKSILCGILIFLGAYCAFYTVSDWHFKRMAIRPFMPIAAEQEFERQMIKDMHNTDKMFKSEKNPFARRGSANIIHFAIGSIALPPSRSELGCKACGRICFEKNRP